MISAPSSSSASCVRAFTAAAVPTGIKNGVSTVPCGVVSRPRRAPVGSVFATAKEKSTASVYQHHPVDQEKMNAHPTRNTTKTAQTVKATENVLPPFSFFGFVAANPIASRTSVQIVKISIDLPSATSHFAESSGKTAARFAATGLSRSTLPMGFKYRMRMKRGLLHSPVRNACEVMLNEVSKFVFAPPSKL